MIGFNGTYLPAATHHGMRITAACLGGQWVFNYKWLTHATQQAILAAFGAEEGTQVIKATNDYLNLIAATDTARAQQLADFINEDPLLVCSLVETSKVRRIHGNNNYVTLGDYDWGNISYDIKAWLYNMSEFDTQLIGGSTWSYSSWITQIIRGGLCNTMCDGNKEVALPNNDLSMRQDNNVVTIRGTQKPRNATFTGVKTVYLFGAANAHNTGAGVEWVKIQSNITLTNDADFFVPFITKDGVVELLNTRTGQYAQRSGELTIALTPKTTS